jgi:hypothetical protein
LNFNPRVDDCLERWVLDRERVVLHGVHYMLRAIAFATRLAVSRFAGRPLPHCNLRGLAPFLLPATQAVERHTGVMLIGAV